MPENPLRSSCGRPLEGDVMLGRVVILGKEASYPMESEKEYLWWFTVRLGPQNETAGKSEKHRCLS